MTNPTSPDTNHGDSSSPSCPVSCSTSFSSELTEDTRDGTPVGGGHTSRGQPAQEHSSRGPVSGDEWVSRSITSGNAKQGETYDIDGPGNSTMNEATAQWQQISDLEKAGAQVRRSGQMGIFES